MKITLRKLPVLLLTASGAVLYVCNAQAQLNMQERERVQTIVWIVEAATFVTVIVIALLIWQISTRARKNKGQNKTDNKNEPS